jgi:hypothetical protein
MAVWPVRHSRGGLRFKMNGLRTILVLSARSQGSRQILPSRLEVAVLSLPTPKVSENRLQTAIVSREMRIKLRLSKSPAKWGFAAITRFHVSSA